MDRAQIQAEWDKFIEYPSDDKRIVTTTSALLFAEHIAKLQATQEPAQAGELPDEREAFETHARSNGWRDEDFRPSSNTQHGYTYRYASTEQCWQFWRARAALAARKPLSAVVLGESMSATFPGSNESSDGWFHQPDDPLQLAASLRRIAKEREQEFNSTFYFGYVADMLETCPHCHGSGLDEETFEACTKCNGTGKRDGLEVKT